jgi:chloramphenicol 3-O-phosphotransferase
MHLILINGQGGTGKTSLAQALRNQIPNSAYIEADSLIAVNPFEFEKLGPLLHINAASLIQNFAQAGYETIITAGLTRNQEQLDEFLKVLNTKADITFVWLRASKEARLARRKERSRDGADNEEHFEFMEKIYPDVESFTAPGKFVEIDTTDKTVEEMKDEVYQSLQKI